MANKSSKHMIYMVIFVPLVFTELLLQSVIQIIKPRAVGPSALEPAWSVIDCNPEALESHWKSWKRWTRSIRKTWGLGSLHADVFPEEVKLRVWEPLGGTFLQMVWVFFRLSLPKLNMDPPPQKVSKRNLLFSANFLSVPKGYCHIGIVRTI